MSSHQKKDILMRLAALSAAIVLSDIVLILALLNSDADDMGPGIAILLLLLLLAFIVVSWIVGLIVAAVIWWMGRKKNPQTPRPGHEDGA